MKTAVDIETGKILLLEMPERGEDIPPSQETLDTLSDQVTTLRNDLDDLGDQVLTIQGDVNGLKINSASKTNMVAEKSFTLNGENVGEMVQVNFIGSTAQLATNNGLDILADTNFLTTPTIENPSSYDIMLPNGVVTKSQVQGAISDVAGSHFDKWILMGKPENITLTESLQKVSFPMETRFPSIPPASMELNEDGTGIKFLKSGLVHIKRNVSLGGSNTENLYYEARINNQTLEPLQTQAVSISQNTMSFSIEFYWQVSAMQEISIWANCLNNTVPLNYKGVCMMIEYL